MTERYEVNGIKELISKNHIPEFKSLKELFITSIQKSTVPGWFLEFGLWRGRSARIICEIISPEVLYGFDSFEGLEEDFAPSIKKGAFKLNEIPVYHPNVKVVIGRFSNSLPQFLKNHKDRIRFIHMDADVYGATREVLFTLAKDKRIEKGTVIQFDELFYSEKNEKEENIWIRGEYNAFREFVGRFDVKFKYLGYSAYHVSILIEDIEYD